MDGISETIAVALQADALPLGRSRGLTGLAGPGGASSDRRRKSISPTMFAAGVRLVDTACALVSLSLIWECAADSISAVPRLHLASLVGTVTVLVCMAHGGYAVADLRDLGKQARALARSLCLGLFAAGGVLFVLQDSHALSRRWLWAWLVASSVLLSGWRIGLRAMLAVLDRSGSLSRRIAVIGSPDLAGRVATQVNAIPADWRLVGLYDDHFEPLGSTPRVGLLGSGLITNS